MVNRERFLQPHKGITLLQEIQKMEVYENVEKDYQASEQNESSKFTRRKTVHAPGLL